MTELRFLASEVIGDHRSGDHADVALPSPWILIFWWVEHEPDYEILHDVSAIGFVGHPLPYEPQLAVCQLVSMLPAQAGRAGTPPLLHRGIMPGIALACGCSRPGDSTAHAYRTLGIDPATTSGRYQGRGGCLPRLMPTIQSPELSEKLLSFTPRYNRPELAARWLA